MGEMADYFNEQVEYAEHRRFMYRTGDLSQIEAYEEGIIDELGYEFGRGTAKSCRCCHVGNLHWQQLNGKWRLFDEKNELHKCPKNPLKQ